MNNTKSRLFTFILYPTDETHIKALEYIKKEYKQFAYILHDKDVIKNDNGEEEKKLPHYHVVVKFPNPRYINGICNELGITNNYCHIHNNIKNALLYLIHYNNKDKYEYDMKDVKGSLYSSLEKYINYENTQEDERIIDILKMINDEKRQLKYSDILYMICVNGQYADYRRGYSIFKAIIEEHNAMYYQTFNTNNE